MNGKATARTLLAFLGSLAGALTISLAAGASPGGTTPAGYQDAGETNIVIGLLLPETEPLGLSLRQGALLGVEDCRKNNGKLASLVIRGASGQWGTDALEAARMVTDDGAQGLIAAPDGSGSHLALQVAGRTAVPVISLCGDSSVTETGVRWMVRVTPRTIDEATRIFCGLNPRITKRWLACVPGGRRGREIVHDLTDAARISGVSLQKTVEVKWPMVDLPALCGRVLTNGADGILLWLDPIPAAALLKGLETAGFKGWLAGPSWLRCSDFEAGAGAAMENFLMASPIRDKAAKDRFERFASAFRARFGQEPDPMAAMSYDAAQLLIQILSRAGSRPAHEVFPLDFSFSGVTGILVFDAQGNRKVELELREGRGDRFVPDAQLRLLHEWPRVD